jgi:hypothetical protein
MVMSDLDAEAVLRTPYFNSEEVGVDPVDHMAASLVMKLLLASLTSTFMCPWRDPCNCLLSSHAPVVMGTLLSNTYALAG